jgi:glycosyltransferase involved in cell wall biosynthesis
MLEIAEIFYEGFKNHVQAELVIDKIPTNKAGEIQIIIAPHEFYPLFLLQKCSPEQLLEITKNSYLLNVEQPGSPWFEFAYEHCQHAKGVLDINEQGVKAFNERGIPAILAPLGYAPCLESKDYNAFNTKPIDIVFLGHSSAKRIAFLAKYADFFSKYNCRLILSRLDKPRLADTPGFYADEERNNLLASTKILINLHSSDRKYFEWHRAQIAIANKCLVISEPSEHYQPLINGEHLIITELEEIIDACEFYLTNEDKRSQLTNNAYQLVTSQISADNICQRLLDEILQLKPLLQQSSSANTAKNPLIKFNQFTQKLKQISKRITKPGIKELILTRKQQLFDKSLYSKITRTAWSTRHIFADLKDFRTPRRNAFITRLEIAKYCDFTGKKPYELIPNTAYQNSDTPSVSVIISLFNYAEYICECLDSVVKSNSDNLPGGFEIIVVDDGSTDESADLVAAYLNSSATPICLVKKAFNTGLADVRNVGLKVARAAYVFILDADNRIYPHCLSTLYQEIASSNYASVYGMIQAFDNQTNKGIGLISYLDWEESLLVKTPYIDAMALFDKNILLKLGGYSTELIQYGWFGWEDYDLWLKVAQAGYACKLIPQILTSYRVHSSSMINTTDRYSYQIARYFKSKFAKLVKSHNDLDAFFGFNRRFLE